MKRLASGDTAALLAAAPPVGEASPSPVSKGRRPAARKSRRGRSETLHADRDVVEAAISELSACRALLKITPDGVVTTALRNEPPWHPTGVVVNGDVIYVLEYLHTNGGDRREWTPRVRRISPGGSSIIIAEIERSGAKDSRPVQVHPTRP